MFALARFSEAFLVLRAPQVSIAFAWVPPVIVATNLVHAATAYRFGRLADRMSRGRLRRLSTRNVLPPRGATVALPCHTRARGG